MPKITIKKYELKTAGKINILASLNAAIRYYTEEVRKKFKEIGIDATGIATDYDYFARQYCMVNIGNLSHGKTLETFLDELFDLTQKFVSKKILYLKLKNYKEVSDLLRDRTAASKTEFPKKPIVKGEEVEGGSTKSYTAIGPDGLLFRVKRVEKDSSAIREAYGFDAMNFVAEFTTSLLWERFLYFRAPKIAEVTEGKDGYHLYLRSKFLAPAKTLFDFAQSEYQYILGDPDNIKLSKEEKEKSAEEQKKLINEKRKRINDVIARFHGVEAVEKIFAGILMLGEYDIHPRNLVVMNIGTEEKPEWVLAKIDHGWSATQFFTKPETVLQNLANAFKRYGYQGKLPLRAEKLKEALVEMTSISDEEIDKLIDSKLYRLKMLGFDIKDLQFSFWIDDEKHKYDEDINAETEASPFNRKNFEHLASGYHRMVFNSYAELAEYYKFNLKRQRNVMKDVIKQLDAISKIDINHATKQKQEQWETGGWLQQIMGQDPVKYAKSHNLTIAGMNPDEWKKLNGFRESCLTKDQGKQPDTCSLLISFILSETPLAKQFELLNFLLRGKGELVERIALAGSNIKAMDKFCEYILSQKHLLLHTNPSLIDKTLALQRLLKKWPKTTKDIVVILKSLGVISANTVVYDPIFLSNAQRFFQEALGSQVQETKQEPPVLPPAGVLRS